MGIYKNLSLENLPNEEWVFIKGFEGLYKISNMGRVKSMGQGLKNHIRIMKQRFSKTGYLYVNLYGNNKVNTIRVHRQVGIHFITNAENKPQVNHKKGIKIDNRASELEWHTAKENINHAFAHGLIKKRCGGKNPRARKVIQFQLDGITKIKTWDSIVDAYKSLKLPKSSISLCCRGYCSQAGNYKWKYESAALIPG